MMSFPKLSAYTISGVNRLDHQAKLDIYSRMIPSEVMERFNIGADFLDSSGNNLLTLECPSGSTSTEMGLRHQFDFTDPILYGHITDTINGQIHVLLYILNDPSSPRFDIDHLPDGTFTEFGTRYRNIPAEIASLEFGLAPGQVRRGLRLLRPAIAAFEQFVTSIGQNIYFVEPLFYHNAIIFERYGFAYEKGRRLMEGIQVGFSQGDLIEKLENTNPFRQPGAVSSIRLRSWAIHDGLLGEPFTNVTMYKRIGEPANVSTCQDCSW